MHAVEDAVEKGVENAGRGPCRAQLHEHAGVEYLVREVALAVLGVQAEERRDNGLAERDVLQVNRRVEKAPAVDVDHAVLQAAQAALGGEAAAGAEREHRGQELGQPRAANVVKGPEPHLEAARAAVVVHVHDGHEHADGGEELRGLVLGDGVEFEEHRRRPDSACETVALEFQALHALR